QDDAEDLLALQEAGVRHDHVDARRRLVAEGHADVDHDPLAVGRRPVAVQIEVHADLVRPAQRQEDELVALGLFHGVRSSMWALRRQISSRPRMVRSGSKWSMLAVAPSNRETTPPVATTVIGAPYSAFMRAMRLSISPT